MIKMNMRNTKEYVMIIRNLLEKNQLLEDEIQLLKSTLHDIEEDNVCGLEWD